MEIKIKKLKVDAVIPTYGTPGAAGFDLYSAETTRVLPGCMHKVSLGLAFEIPEGYEIQIRPRSGVSAKTGLIIKNSPGTIDSDYRGEVSVLFFNTGRNIENIAAGDRIAQGVLAPVLKAEFKATLDLSSTERGDGGWGSSGT